MGNPVQHTPIYFEAARRTAGKEERQPPRIHSHLHNGAPGYSAEG
jgi:hypothetical protein